jgi:hypothetical protein
MAFDQAQMASRARDSEQGSAQEVVSQVQDKAQDVKGQATAKVREQLDVRSTELGEHASSVGDALRGAAEQLEGDGKEVPARLARQGAAQIDRLGGYLKNSDSDRFLGDLERFGRSRPWAAGGVGALLGFMGSRFLKASSDRRSHSLYGTSIGAEAPHARDGYSTSASRPELPTAGRGVQ